MGNQTVTPPSPPHSACLPSCGQPTAGTFFHANGCPNNLMRTNPPSPPQSAERMYNEVRNCINRVSSLKMQRDIHAALDACIRAVIAEWGHRAGCGCEQTEGGGWNLESECAPPSWLPEVRDGK